MGDWHYRDQSEGNGGPGRAELTGHGLIRMSAQIYLRHRLMRLLAIHWVAGLVCKFYCSSTMLSGRVNNGDT